MGDPILIFDCENDKGRDYMYNFIRRSLFERIVEVGSCLVIGKKMKLNPFKQRLKNVVKF